MPQFCLRYAGKPIDSEFLLAGFNEAAEDFAVGSRAVSTGLGNDVGGVPRAGALGYQRGVPTGLGISAAGIGF